MRILVNTSTILVGGAVQVALSFINELKNIEEDNEYHILASPAIEKQLDKSSFDKRFTFYLIEISPARLLTRLKITKILNSIENKINPDIVFSVFGPSYWRPKSIHLVGFANGWAYNPNSIAYDKLNFISRYKMKLYVKYTSYYLTRDSDYIVLETNDAKEKFTNVLKFNRDRLFVVGNAYNQVFDNKSLLETSNSTYIKLSDNDYFKLIYVAHNHPSKNMSLIKNIIASKKNPHIQFMVTLDKKSFESYFDTNEPQIINLGRVNVNSLPSVYSQANAMFMPSLLETFSATYLEAMKMKIPILASDFSFSREICGNSAIYFDSLDESDALEKINLLMNDKRLQKELVENGIERLKTFETAKSRATKYLEICKKLIENKIIGEDK